MTETGLRKLALVIKRALRAPVSVVLLSGGILWAALLRDTWGVLGLIGAVAAVTVYALVKLQDESFIREAVRQAHEVERRSDAMKFEFRIEELDVESRIRMKSIVKLQGEIAEEVDDSPIDAVSTGMADTVTQTAALVERGLAMSQKRRELERYLHKTDPGAIQSRINSIENKLAAEIDPTRKAEVEVSLKAKRQELDDYKAIAASAERVLEQLDGIECSFSSLKTRLIRIKSAGVDEWTAANQELRTELAGLNTAVDSLEQSVNEVLNLQT